MHSNNNFTWEKYIQEALNSTNYCCIATVDAKGVWSNPVFFAWDDRYNIYFISQMNSRHMQNLTKNNNIAVSVYKTEQKDDVLGIQLEGTAKILSEQNNAEELQHAFQTYYDRAGHGQDVEEYINNSTWLYVKIVPEKMYYFDTRFFGEERREVPLDELKR